MDDGPVPRDLGKLARDWWLLDSDEDEHWLAFDEVFDAAMEPAADVVDVLNALLTVPGAEAGYVGAGPLQTLLQEHGVVVQEAVAARCAASPDWRAAIQSVWLRPSDNASMPKLLPYLPEPVLMEDQPTRKASKPKPRKKTSRDTAPRRGR